MRDILKSTFKETSESFRNAVNNVIVETAQGEYKKRNKDRKQKEKMMINNKDDNCIYAVKICGVITL